MVIILMLKTLMLSSIGSNTNVHINDGASMAVMILKILMIGGG